MSSTFKQADLGKHMDGRRGGMDVRRCRVGARAAC